MTELLNQVMDQIDIGASLSIYGATVFITYLLNLLFRKTYTDWVAPFAAALFGQVDAYWAHNHYDAHAVVDGFKITGGAIIFQQLIAKGMEGAAWFTKGDKDPVLKAKVETTGAKAETQIAKMKALLQKNKE